MAPQPLLVLRVDMAYRFTNKHDQLSLQL